MEIRVEKSSLFRNEKPIADKLISEISGFLQERGQDHIDLVREQARKQLEELIENGFKVRRNLNIKSMWSLLMK